MNKYLKISTINSVKHITDTLFGKFFYSDSLFSMNRYTNKVHTISFKWSYRPGSTPCFYSIVCTPLQKEMMLISKDKKIVSYRKETLLY